MTNQREKYARLYNVWKKLSDRTLDDRQIITNAGHKNVLRWFSDGTRCFEHDDAVWKLDGLYCLADFYNIPEPVKVKFVEYIHPKTLGAVHIALADGLKIERSVTKDGKIIKWAQTKQVHDDYLVCRYRIIAEPKIQDIKSKLKDMIEKTDETCISWNVAQPAVVDNTKQHMNWQYFKPGPEKFTTITLKEIVR